MMGGKMSIVKINARDHNIMKTKIYLEGHGHNDKISSHPNNNCPELRKMTYISQSQHMGIENENLPQQ